MIPPSDFILTTVHPFQPNLIFAVRARNKLLHLNRLKLKIVTTDKQSSLFVQRISEKKENFKALAL